MGDRDLAALPARERAGARLKHPHVVRTLDSGVDAATGLMFLVMPLLKGRDLDRVLEELGALEPETAVRIALQAARGLSAAHRIGIIHRDVKPGNLILDEEDDEIIVRVCDFGIAKQMGGESELTTTGSQLGTPDYVSPEQLKSSKHVDERTDVWSLGATLYQMLCGAAPVRAHRLGLRPDRGDRDRRRAAPAGSRALGRRLALADRAQSAAARPEPALGHARRHGGRAAPVSPAVTSCSTPSRIRAVATERRSTVAPRADLKRRPQPNVAAARPDSPRWTSSVSINQTLDGRYLVKRLIGKGGMGNVYEVETRRRRATGGQGRVGRRARRQPVHAAALRARGQVVQRHQQPERRAHDRRRLRRQARLPVHHHGAAARRRPVERHEARRRARARGRGAAGGASRARRGGGARARRRASRHQARQSVPAARRAKLGNHRKSLRFRRRQARGAAWASARAPATTA